VAAGRSGACSATAGPRSPPGADRHRQDDGGRNAPGTTHPRRLPSKAMAAIRGAEQSHTSCRISSPFLLRLLWGASVADSPADSSCPAKPRPWPAACSDRRKRLWKPSEICLRFPVKVASMALALPVHEPWHLTSRSPVRLPPSEQEHAGDVTHRLGARGLGFLEDKQGLARSPSIAGGGSRRISGINGSSTPRKN